MLPMNFSFHETLAKHRNPDEIDRIDKQNRAMAARNYQYGDPRKQKVEMKAQKSAEPDQVVSKRGSRHAFPLASFFIHFFSSFTSRHGARF